MFAKGSFEWDPRKAKINTARHGVQFVIAQTAFEDPNALVDLDDYTEEERWRLIGTAQDGSVLLVVYTERERDGEIVRRIISARKATRRERARYGAEDR